jgi:hypothetical protein
MPLVSEHRPSLLILSWSRIHRDARVLRQLERLADDYAVTTCGYGPAPVGVVAHHQIPDEVSSWRTDRRLVVARLFQRAYDSAPVTRYVRSVLRPGEHDIILANDVNSVPVAIGLACTQTCTNTPPGSRRRCGGSAPSWPPTGPT